MKKHWSFLLGASVVTGIASSLLFKHGKKKLDENRSTADLIKVYQGQWWFVDKKKATQHQLTIDDKLTIVLDGKELEFALIEWNMTRLTIQDSFGFHLIIETKADKPATLYDEADDSTYLLEAVVPVEKLIEED
ncbi:DUF4828 domain-containing protein [Candidatus Enterococcus clewellii]|uniref:DUF4828 domain-containing protein n=1 Tax=Candidatus Enterococcus clewellii TaxID=1834193 RepID=A0A242K2U8_9ENTE|nr:DUF4828 domain-containing protein [Enterococcus sp. 9E7_DIV0242]OTP12911.1 hypothetical protein A5888_003493 [Enterococcus sp. 9E7_DIV0242]